MLKRALIIDDAEDTEVLVRICMHAHWPDAVLEMYDPKCGLPDIGFDWKRYDLLLLDYDLGLEDENGLIWLSKLVNIKHLPATIMLTSYATEKLSDKSLEYGAADFLDKSKINPDIFYKSVSRSLSNHNLKQSVSEAVQAEDEKTALINMEEINIEAPATGEDFEEPIVPVEDSEKVTDKVRTSGIKPGPTTTTTTSSQYTTSKVSKQASQPTEIKIVVPGYSILKKIGEGGMASIYLAESDDDKLKVVLKVLSLEGEGSSTLLRRFMREYKLIAQIQHRNVVQIYERAFASDFAYIAMEYFKYGDLTRKFDQDIDARTAVGYLNQIAQGLGAAHEKGIVHRDMKPANILFRTEHELAVTDFGIAKLSEDEAALKKQLTLEGELMGTIYYISPEQIEGAEADQRSDIYSLGVIMYKMLTGQHPFTGASYNEIFEGHLYGPIPTLPGELSKLQPILDGLLAKDPDERFQSTDDFIMGLEWEG